MDKIRVDKWLWSVRIFKSRTRATEMCKSGKVSIRESKVKPSQSIAIDDIVEVNKNGYNFRFKVKELLTKRVSAILAQEAYDDLTPPEELNKYEDWFVGKASAERRLRGTGRPTKHDRRTIDRFKQEFYFDE
jgi:ribosome-associated heat shock protein Hsp15